MRLQRTLSYFLRATKIGAYLQSPETDINLRYYAQTLFLDRVGLDKGVQVSLSSISDPQTSSLASESTSFCASLSPPSSAEACLLCIVFSCKDLVEVALHSATCAVTVYFACLARLLMNFSWELQVIHSPSSDGNKFILLWRTQFWFRFLAVWGLVLSCWCHDVTDFWLMQTMATCPPVDLKELFCNSKTNDSARECDAFLIFFHHSSSVYSLTRTWMTRSSKLKTHYKSRVTREDYTTAA